MNNNIVKVDYLIAKRDQLTADINKYWRIINTENVIKKGFSRNYDMKVLLEKIKELYEEHVVVKLRIQCVNMGMKLKELSPDANVVNIYRLSAMKEYSIRLGIVNTINPTQKAKKGKRKLPVTEVLTHNYIKARQAECQLVINELDKKVKEFNSSTEIDLSEAPMYLAA